MGWTGVLMDRPIGKDRINAAIRQEGYYGSDEGRTWEVIGSAIVGTTVYLACHFTDTAKGVDRVYGVVILTEYRCGEFLTKAVSEDMGPHSYDCPKRILKLLSPTDSEWALEWRSKCEEKRRMKRNVA